MTKATLAGMIIGQRAEIKAMETAGRMRRRLRDLGIVEGAAVECVARGPSGDPAAFLVCGAVIALRSEDMALITVQPMNEDAVCARARKAWA